MSGPSVNDAPGRAGGWEPEVFGRYLLLQRLSRGGMGEIFLAKHGLAGFEKLVVIKKVLPNLAADQQFISRFIDEAQVAIKLQHVNIAQVFEVGRVGEEYFLAIEHVDGRDLRRTLTVLEHRHERLPSDLALLIARELANGLAYAHRRTDTDGTSLGLVHCDISPPNVLVSFEGETKVIDFGIAKSRLSGTSTDPKLGFGKFGYMAPEQLIRGGKVDARTDIYASGAVLFELLTGERLYPLVGQPDYRALARQVTRGEHRLPSQLDPALAPFDDLVLTALRPKPDARYQTAAEFRDAIAYALARVHPTISNDRLGAFMAGLFRDELDAARAVHERAARTSLADFEEELSTQAVETVTFAQAAPVAPAMASAGERAASPSLGGEGSALATVPGGASGRRRRPSSIVPAAPNLLAMMAEVGVPEPRRDVGLPLAAPPPGASAGMPAVVEPGLGQPGLGERVPVTSPVLPGVASPITETVTHARSRAALVLVAAAAIGVAIGAVVYATSRGRSRAVTAGSPDAPGNVVAVVPVDAAGPDAAPAMDAAPPTRDASAEPIDARRTGPVTPRQVDAPPREPTGKLVDADAVQARFRGVTRTYREFRAKFGERLEPEWADLLTFSQYARDRGDWAGLEQRLGQFERQLARATKEGP